MIDKELLRLLGGGRKYIFYTVGAIVIGLIANISITAGICYAIRLLSQSAEPSAYRIYNSRGLCSCRRCRSLCRKQNYGKPERPAWQKGEKRPPRKDL